MRQHVTLVPRNPELTHDRMDFETMAELRTRVALAEERLTELKAMLEDMRRDRDAWREQAQTRLLPAPAVSWWRRLRTTG